MFRHLSRPTRALGAAALAAAAVVFSPAAARAQSVQVFINDAFVANANNGNASLCSFGGTPPRYTCLISNQPQLANISNDPEIQFEADGLGRCGISAGSQANLQNNFTTVGGVTYRANPGSIGMNVCNSQVFLCAQVGVAQNTGGSSVAIDQVEFEIFRFVDGANPLDPASTPPLRTFFIDSPGSIAGTAGNIPDDTHAYCVLWDGSQPIQGGFGKINGSYGFRVTVQTNQVGQSGNITITQTRAYPSGATLDAIPPGNSVPQKAILVDVTDVHVVRSTPSVVGQITGVSAEPYNFTYRLSKDATMYLTINEAMPPFSPIRNVVPGLPRTGEGALANANATPLLNGDSWDGRDSFGNILPAGSYLAVFQSNSADQYTLIDASHPGDLADATTTQVSIDPLQITDIRVQPLLGGSTALAVLSYQLTEPATVYVDVYPPGTQFCNDVAGNPALTDLNSQNTDPGLVTPFPAAKNLSAVIGPCGPGGTTVIPVRSIVQQQNARTPVISFWDGRDTSGNFVGDGDYVFAVYAALPSQKGLFYNNLPADPRVWTSVAKTGFISVLRGLVGITQVTPTSTIIGSSPAIAGLNPFTFRYQLARDAVVSMKVFDFTGRNLVKTLVNNETRPGLFNNLESWTDGTGDNGLMVSSGTYLIQLTAYDPAFPTKVSTATALFPVDLFRVTDVLATPLLAGASDQVVLNYQLSQPMLIAWNIYPAGSYVAGSTTAWPPCATQNPPGPCTSPSVLTPQGLPAGPVVSFHGIRPGRLKITEFWDGRDSNGLFVPDGSYVFTLTAMSTGTPQHFATDRVYGNVTVARGAIVFQNFNVIPDVPALFNSSNTITLDPFTISYTLSRQSSVTVQVLNTAIPPTVVRTLVSGSVRQGGILQTDVWDGRDDLGNFPPSGFYLVRAIASDVASILTSGSTAQLTVSYDPLRIYDLAVTPLRNDIGNALISYQVSEPMKVSIKIYKRGTAFDASGNPAPPDSQSLVRRIVGVRPARTQIQDSWDGRDFRLALVPDGDYPFKIVGSTDPTAIDDITGNVLNPAALAEDRLIDRVTVANNGSADPQGDFVSNTFVYPNPVAGPQGTFQIYTPFHARVLFKMYDLSGSLILSKDFGDNAPSFQAGPVTYVWNKINQSGKAVARGLYYVVIRIEETEGGGNVLQTVKKVLVP